MISLRGKWALVTGASRGIGKLSALQLADEGVNLILHGRQLAHLEEIYKAVTEKGFRYFDWNVTSGDAGETTSTDQVVKIVINGIRSQGTAVVLQHDIKSFSVDAVERIIIWGLENGYSFKPLDAGSPGCHHGVNN